MNIQSLFLALALAGTTWVLWLLVALSMLGLGIALERGLTLWATRESEVALRELGALLRGGYFQSAARRLSSSSSHEAKIVRAGVEAAAQGAGAAEQRMRSVAAAQRVAMERGLAVLGAVGEHAPLLGLFGTVVGIIAAVHSPDPGGLMSRVGDALVATAAGIAVALPAAVTHHLFLRINHARLVRAEALGRDLLAALRARRLR